MREFSPEEWASIAERLDAHEGGYDADTFRIWLAYPESQTRLVQAFGAAWTLAQALTLATGGPEAVRRVGKATLKKKVADALAKTQDPAAALGPNLEKRIQDKLAIYLAQFRSDADMRITANDEASLRDLVQAEIALEQLNALRDDEIAKVAELNPAAIKDLTTSIKVLSEQTRALQTILGISRAERLKKKDKGSGLEEVLELIEDAGAWVLENASPIDHCDIHIGFIVSDFREIGFVYQMECPKCHQQFVIEHVPDAADQLAIEPSWVAAEEAQYASSLLRFDEEGSEEE
jgi:hypothetical protein